uniref:Rh50-like protein n=1 Tax=Oncorhynchus kisutch TaxID=8019 RepID=A0A8C7MSV5_ONCKI
AEPNYTVSVKKHFTILRVRMPVLEVLFLAIYAAFVSYNDDAKLQNNETKPVDNALYRYYPFFADIQVMILIGLRCLLVFFCLYGFSGTVFNLLTATFAIQWAILVQGYFQFSHDGNIHQGVINLINAEFACAVVLISFGAVLGKTSLVQLLVKALLEIPVFSINECAVLKYLKINDAGGSILIHLLACYFSLGVTYQSDILSVMDTLFLWVFWSSNFALTLKGDDQHRAILHNFSSSILTAFALSTMLNKNGKITMANIQKVTLAGGVVGGHDDHSCSSVCAGLNLIALTGSNRKHH